MEVLRRYFCLILVCLSSVCFGSKTDDKGYASIRDAIKNPKSTSFIALNADSASLNLLQENIKSFPHLRGLAVQGEIAIPSALWAALSEIELLEYLFFLDNDLKELKVGGTSSTLKYLWIRNSPSLSVQSLNNFLSRSNFIISLRLDRVSFDEIPEAVGTLPILKELQLSHSNVVFKELIQSIKKSNIEKLLISDNNFQFISKGLKKLSGLKYLDVSGNNLSEGTTQLKHLKQVDTLVINRNVIDNLNEVARQIQKTGVDLVVFDDQVEKIKNDVVYLLPGKQIVWNSNVCFPQTIELPSFNENMVVRNAELDATKNASIKNYNEVGDVKVLSEAYLEYDRLLFPDPLKHIDTLKYKARYMDSSYVFVRKIEIQNHTRGGEKHKLKFSRKYGGVKKKKKTVKINHDEDSHVVFQYYEDRACDDGPIVTLGLNHLEEHKRNDLKAFQQYVWLVRVSEASFSEHFIDQKAWSDVRIEFDGGVFTVKLKGRFTNDEFTAELRYKRDPNELRKLEKSVNKAFVKYEGGSKKEAARFNKKVKKEERKSLRPYANELADLWAKVEAKMSEEERAMSRIEWIEYYRKVKAVEYNLLPNTSFNLAFLARYMVSQGFREKRSNDFYVGQKWIDATTIYQKDTLEIDQLCIVDIDQKMVSKVDVKKNKILLEPFHDVVIYGVSKQQQFFSLTKEQVDQLFNSGTVHITAENMINSFPTTATFYREDVFPLLTY